MKYNSIYDYIKAEETNYQKPIEVIEGWNWTMKEHIRRAVLYKNSQFIKNNENRDERPFKNVIRPILNVQYRTEGVNVKNLNFYLNQKKKNF